MKKPRTILLAGNWKMNYGPQATLEFFSNLSGRLSSLPADRLNKVLQEEKSLELCIAPPTISIFAAIQGTKSLPYPMDIACQNVHWEKSGAFTGEIAGPMLKEIGVTSALVGHSERRQFFGETDTTARKRTESLLHQGFRVIFCMGETREQREAGQTETILLKQLSTVLVDSLASFLDGRLIIAYEPVWAIGTGLTATTEQAEEAHQIIRKFLWDHFGLQAAGKTQILYGGSVTTETLPALLSCANVDGALIGGASLKPENWISFIESAIR